MRKPLTLACALLALTASATRVPQRAFHAIASLGVGRGPYLPGSRVVPEPAGLPAPYALAVVGPGSVHANAYVAPATLHAAEATLIAGNADAIATARIALVPAPGPDRALIAVATYDDGVTLHDARDFARIGTVATGGAPSDVAFARDGSFSATSTAGESVTTVTRAPWSVTFTQNVPFGDEIAIADDGTVFVTNRSVGAASVGALTRILPSGAVTRVVTGETAEGLALDERQHVVYVGNVNDGTVLALDMRTMRPLRHIRAVPRVFGIALGDDGKMLYVVANQSAASQFQAPGYVEAIALRGARPRVVARSRNLYFPLGVAVDGARGRVFVTDEAADVVYVLDARTLRDVHAPLHTCDTPWKPLYDAPSHRLFVPCARADRVDVFDAETLRRVAGAPFATGGYPLAVSLWRPPSADERR